MVAVLDHWWLVLPGIVVFAFLVAPMIDGRPTPPAQRPTSRGSEWSRRPPKVFDGGRRIDKPWLDRPRRPMVRETTCTGCRGSGKVRARVRKRRCQTCGGRGRTRTSVW